MICSLILQRGYEEVVPNSGLVEKLFTPLPVQLLGRTFSEIVQRAETLQPIFLEFVKSKKRFSGAELFKLLLKKVQKKDLRGAEPILKRARTWKKFSVEEDFCICSEIARAVYEQRAPPVFGQHWFRLNLVESGLLVSRSSNTLYERFRWHLKPGLFAVVERARATSLSLNVPLSLDFLEESVLQWLRLLHNGLEEPIIAEKGVEDDQTKISLPTVNLKVVRP